MNIISIIEASKDFGVKTLFKNLNLHIHKKDRLGLIGPNGAGKSTLLKVIAGTEPLNEGERHCAKQLKIALVSQEESLNNNETIIESILKNCGEKRDLLLKFDEISNSVGKSPGNKNLLEKLNKISELMDQSNAWNLEVKIKEVLEKLGITETSRFISSLSGGYKKRVSLASALVSEPDLLLLDEPTNHLDADSVNWLENWLKEYKGALVLITHDRYVLDKVTERMLEVDQGETILYSGNYSKFLEQKAESEYQKNLWNKKMKGLLRRELNWLKQGPKARSTKQKARIKRIIEMQENPINNSKKKLDMKSSKTRIGKLIIEANNIKITSNGKKDGKCLLKEFSYSFNKEDRVGIIGPNGIGKSSLLDVLSGKSLPVEGQLKIGQTIKIGYLDQKTENLHESSKLNKKVLNFVEEVGHRIKLDKTEISASQLLENFLFPPAQQHSPLSKLSGGEKRRLSICRMLLASPNVILLDEPTNDLDTQTLSILEEFLDDFQGCVIIISHDRYFLDRTVDRIFNFENGYLKRFEGNYSNFISHKKKISLEQKQESKVAKKNKLKSSNQSKILESNSQKKKRSYKDSREIIELENKLPILEKERKKLEDFLSVANGNLTEESKELANVIEKIYQAEERWLELNELET